jgi:hypothetical protein
MKNNIYFTEPAVAPPVTKPTTEPTTKPGTQPGTKPDIWTIPNPSVSPTPKA